MDKEIKESYYKKALRRAWLYSPLIISFGALPLVYNLTANSLIRVASLCIAVFSYGYVIKYWHSFVKQEELPETLVDILLPVFHSCAYYFLVFVILFGILGSRIYKLFMCLCIFATPFSPMLYAMSIGIDIIVFVVAFLLLYLIIILTVVFTCKQYIKTLKKDKRAVKYFSLFLLFGIVAGYQFRNQKVLVLGRDYYVEQLSDEVQLYYYQPFYSYNRLAIFEGEPSLVISRDYPRLDGATAAYPVYGAVVQATYANLNHNSVAEYVQCNQTIQGYERLINGEIDIFFGAQPSEQQLALAREQGVELRLIPIAQEAFVFFVNSENPVDSLTLEQIRAIYLKDITNWQEVGGNYGNILPFQRPESSGSQTIMIAYVMQGQRLPPPLQVEYQGGMGGIVKGVATYRNYYAAIGYSFRYYATVMNPDVNIKFLAINGVEPTPENISNGTYPLTITVYAVTTGNESDNTKLLIEWMLSEEGQDFIEECGYVRLSESE